MSASDPAYYDTLRIFFWNVSSIDELAVSTAPDEGSGAVMSGRDPRQTRRNDVRR